MAEGDKKYSKALMGKTVVSKSGKKLGVVGDLVFEVRTGELIYLVLRQSTPYAGQLELEKTKDGEPMVPFSSMISSSDFVVVAEEDIV
ncbi:MAG TPA: PRC-barrel domain-containing protein [Candidatus Nanoarchaeia archaeon]|nr:PRC-barrel domain-containing protein [Candidatus Nanoarchaeia archaeon]